MVSSHYVDGNHQKAAVEGGGAAIRSGNTGKCPLSKMILTVFTAVLAVLQWLTFLQRAASTESSSAASPFYLTAAASAATATAIGSVAFYYSSFGQEAFAMTPAEEGSVFLYDQGVGIARLRIL